MRRVIATLGILAATLTLGACSVADSRTGSDKPTDSSSAPKTPQSTNPKLGQTYTYDDGLAISASAPTEFTPSETAFGAVDGQKSLAFAITITNGTDADFDPILCAVALNSGGAESDQIMDSANGYELAPSTTVLPGKSVTFKVAFSALDSSDLTLEVAPDFDRDQVLFTL